MTWFIVTVLIMPKHIAQAYLNYIGTETSSTVDSVLICDHIDQCDQQNYTAGVMN